MHTRILLSALLASVAIPAFAADMPVKAPIREAVQYTDWSGFYVGVAAGYGWGRQKWDSNGVFPGGIAEDRTIHQVTNLGGGATQTIDVFSQVFLPDFNMPLTSSLKTRGWLAGGFFGAQKQWGNWVIGLEADIDATGIKGTSSATDSFTQTLDSAILIEQTIRTPVQVGNPAQTFNASITQSQTIDIEKGAPNASIKQSSSMHTKFDEIGTLRGKVGLTNVFFGPNFLIYGTGGLAWAHATTTLSASQSVSGKVVQATLNNQGNLVVGLNNFKDDFAIENVTSQTLLGWSLGAGLDWKLTPNLILGVLYLHYEFPKDTLAFSDNGFGTGSFNLGNSRQSIDAVKGRLSVLFPIQ